MRDSTDGLGETRLARPSSRAGRFRRTRLRRQGKAADALSSHCPESSLESGSVTDELKAAFGESSDSESLYHDDGWWSDLGQLRPAMIMFALSVVCFAATLFVYYHPIGNALGSSGYGFLTTTRTVAAGGLVSLLAFVLSILSVGVGIFEAAEYRHRVRGLAWTFAALSALNLVAFIVFAVMTASFRN
jgi:hypothetical protein